MRKILTERLRKETRKEHAHTEGMMNAKMMFSDDYDLDCYTKHLAHLYKAHCLVSEIIKRHKHILPTDQVLPADRSEHIKQDLLNLNKSLLISEFKLKHYSDFSSLPGLIGLIYVVKGSELGGNIIGKQIEKHRKRWHVKPAIFYKTTPQDTLMQDWKTWCNHVNAIAHESNAFIDQTINSAKMAFNLFTHPEKFGEFTTKQVI